jgi:hypothetical protein
MELVGHSSSWSFLLRSSVLGRRAKLSGEGGEKRDKGPTGKQFFKQLEADNVQVQPLLLLLALCSSSLLMKSRKAQKV